MISHFLLKNLVYLTSLISLCVALFLVSIKLWAWPETDSITLLTSAADSLVDVIASLVTLTGVCYAQRPADQDHRYGHGKAEAISAFVQALLLIGMGIILGIESITRIITPKSLSSPNLSIFIIIGSTLCVTFLVILQTLVIKYTDSTAITADRTHYFSDITINISVLIALLLERIFGWIQADAIGALIISCYIIWNVRKTVKASLLQLLDRELSSFDRKKIVSAVLKCHGIEGVHDLRTRNGGDRFFIELHIEVNGNMTVDDGHNICNNAELMVRSLFTAAEVSVHIEPVGITDDRLDNQVRYK